MKKIAEIICTCIILIGCTSTPKVDIQGETDAIRSLENQWTIALQTSDVDKIVTFYSTEAVSMSSNKPIATGLQAIRKNIESMLTDTTLLFNTYTSTIDAIEVSTAGDIGYARGHDGLTIKTKNGLGKDEGKWVDIWKKFNGQWKVIVSVGNSSKPVEGQ
jgi:ketosteroid isomerase-like protein